MGLEFRYEKEMQVPVITWLESQGFVCTRELCSLSYNPIDIVGGRFGQRVSRRIPPLLEAVAIELKLHDINGVLRQSVRNRGCVERAFAAIPASRCGKLKPEWIARFVGEGVGLLSVTAELVTEILPAQRASGTDARIYKNLWRKLRSEGRTCLDTGQGELFDSELTQRNNALARTKQRHALSS